MSTPWFWTFGLLFKVLSKWFFFYSLIVMHIRHWNYRSLTCCLHLASCILRCMWNGYKQVEGREKKMNEIKSVEKCSKRTKGEREKDANVYTEWNIQWQWQNNSLPFGKRYKPNGNFRSILFCNSIHVLFLVVVLVAAAKPVTIVV